MPRVGYPCGITINYLMLSWGIRRVGAIPMWHNNKSSNALLGYREGGGNTHPDPVSGITINQLILSWGMEGWGQFQYQIQ